MTVEFTTAADGKSVPVSGSPTMDAIVVKRVDANTTESTQMKAGKVGSTTLRVVSKDGKTMTSTAKGTNAAGLALQAPRNRRGRRAPSPEPSR